jgi:hypothetical protein
MLQARSFQMRGLCYLCGLGKATATINLEKLTTNNGENDTGVTVIFLWRCFQREIIKSGVGQT